MAKLTTEMIEEINKKCDTVKYGKVIICINETSPTIDIVVEERKQFIKERVPKAGVPVTRYKG
jgi:hypothetical protein